MILQFVIFDILLHGRQTGKTALHYACRGKHLEMAKLLLEHMSRDATFSLNKVDSHTQDTNSHQT